MPLDRQTGPSGEAAATVGIVETVACGTSDRQTAPSDARASDARASVERLIEGTKQPSSGTYRMVSRALQDDTGRPRR
jgi:hypothetical protein